MTVRILVGDARVRLRAEPAESVHASILSPPYWGLRDYGVEASVWGGDEACEHAFADEAVMREVRKGAGLEELSKRYRGGGKKYAKPATFQITRGTCVHCGAWRGALGLEPTPEMFVGHLVEVMAEVYRVLRADGTVWLNIGDSYASASEKGNSGYGTSGLTSGGPYQEEAPRPAWSGRPNAGETSWAGHRGKKTRADRDGTHAGKHAYVVKGRTGSNRAQRGDGNGGVSYGPMQQPNRLPIAGVKPKDMVGIPWMVAFALRDWGWHLRQEIIWSKPNPMPESVTDRCTKAHESLFLLTKLPWYYYDAVAIAEPAAYAPGCGWVEEAKGTRPGKRSAKQLRPIDPEQSFRAIRSTRNKRSVWTVAPEPFKEAHFATFPPALIEPCVDAATSARGCCTGCGAPFERLTAPNEAYLAVLGRSYHEHEEDEVAGNMQNRGENRQNALRDEGDASARIETIGWHPTCHCANLGKLPRYPRAPRLKTEETMSAWRTSYMRVTDARRAMCREADKLPVRPAVVLDPFGGAGTTALVSGRRQRDSVICEMNPRYAEMAERRLMADGGLFARVEVSAPAAVESEAAE